MSHALALRRPSLRAFALVLAFAMLALAGAALFARLRPEASGGSRPCHTCQPGCMCPRLAGGNCICPR